MPFVFLFRFLFLPGKSENRCAAIDFPICGNCFWFLCLLSMPLPSIQGCMWKKHSHPSDLLVYRLLR